MLPIGRPCRFGDCSPGDLIRLTMAEGSTFAFAIEGGAGQVGAAVLLIDGLAGIAVDAHEPVLSYDKRYDIRESMDRDSLHTGGRFRAGVLELGVDREEAYTALMFPYDNRALYYDVKTGGLGQRPSTSTLHLTKWSVLLTADGQSPIEVFQST